MTMTRYEPVTDRDEQDARDLIAHIWIGGLEATEESTLRNAFAQAIANGRRESMENRERELKGRIAAAQRECMERIQPWIKELSDIGLCRPPEPITMPDGRVATYVGPLPTWEPDGLKMPR